jgi:hypothetical protein
MTPEQEQSFEYQQVAALLAFEIELQGDVLENDKDDLTREDLIQIIENLVNFREKVIGDKEYREQKWQAMAMIFNLNVTSTPIG